MPTPAVGALPGQPLTLAQGAPASLQPTIGPLHTPWPTPTPEPPADCRFGNQLVSVPLRDPPQAPLSPGAIPTFHRGTPGWRSVALGEPEPGVFVELRLPTDIFVAGAVLNPEVRVRNTTAGGIGIFSRAWAASDGQDHASGGGSYDARWFPARMLFQPYSEPDTVPPGQTWSFPSTVQLPFDPNQPSHLHAAVELWSLERSIALPSRHIADVPLHLFAADQAQQLRLELQADAHQWCLRATDAIGGRPASPLFAWMEMTMANGAHTIGAPSGGTGDTWAARWDSGGPPITLELWVAGPNYVTARTQVTVLSGP